MSDKEKNKKMEFENDEFEVINDDELDEVSGGSDGLKPPRIDIHPYDSDVTGRM